MLNAFYDKFIFVNALKYSKNNFNLMNVPLVFCPVDLFVGWFGKNKTDFNREIYYAVKDSFNNYLDSHLDLNFPSSKSKKIDLLIQFFSSSGWGKLSVLDFKEKERRAIFSLVDSPIAKELKGKVGFPVDHIMRGILAGMMSSVWEGEYDCVEIKCQAQGESNCEFVIKDPLSFSPFKEITRDQLNMDLYKNSDSQN